MEVAFDCLCGSRISEFTRGDDTQMPNIRVTCPDCNGVYAVTISQLRRGDQDVE